MNYQLISQRKPLLSPIEQVMENRGFKHDEIHHFLNLKEDCVEPASAIANIDNGIKMLIKHIAQKDLTYIQIDSDCDGYTSASILLNYLHCLYPSFVENNIIYRTHDMKAHGISMDDLPDNVKFIIIPDASSNEYDKHKELAERGIDILIIDHHEAASVSSYACVINNQLCDYSNKSLSGAGMVYKFCSRIDELMGKSYSKLYLDLTAVGLVGDMMDTRICETKYLIDQGLENIRNPFLKAMIAKDQFHFSSGVDQHKVAFYIVPFINAIARIGSLEDRRLLFEAMLDYRAYALIPSTKKGCKGQTETIVEQAVRTCANVKRQQTNTRDLNVKIINSLILRDNLLDNKILVIRLDHEHEINKGLTGLIANELANKYQRPTLVLNQIDTDKGAVWEGSGRGCDKSALSNFRLFCVETGLVNFAEGHGGAFGISISDENFNKFIEVSNDLLKDYDFSPSYKVDFIYRNGEDSCFNDVLELSDFNSLWGYGISEPLVVVENIKVTKDQISLMSREKNPTLKIMLNDGTELIKFRSSEKEYESLYSDLGYVIINAVGHCSRNEWMGKITAQIQLEEYEIIAKRDYYF